MPDSFSYLEAAFLNSDVNVWPVGYSKFLRLISVFTHSDTILFLIQYFLVQAGLVFFFLSMLFLFRPGKGVATIFILFILFNPISLYLSNYVSSDSLFLGLSLCWASSLLWVLMRPNVLIVLLQGFLLLACFVIRYGAIHYPVTMAFAFILSSCTSKLKLLGIAFSITLITISYLYTSSRMEMETKVRQFSPFAGWQLANNALYMYEHVPAKNREPVPDKFMGLDKMVRLHIDSIRSGLLSVADTYYSFYYLWNRNSPLIQYMLSMTKGDSLSSYFNRWASVSMLYREYGAFLIRRYPAEFANYFIKPNAQKALMPPLEFLGVYNMEMDSVKVIAKEWFKYKSIKIGQSSWNNRLHLLTYYPVFMLISNLCFLFTSIAAFFATRIRIGYPLLFKALLLFSFFWTAIIIFNIGVAPIVLRYQILPSTIGFGLSVILVSVIYSYEKTPLSNNISENILKTI